MNREEFLSVASQYYEEFESLKSQSNFYDYEKSFVDLWQRLGSEYMEKQFKHGFVISPYMQELMTYAGHLDCYARSHEILEQFLSIKVSPSQVYRVTDHVSESLYQTNKK
jgi:hypothetical protein